MFVGIMIQHGACIMMCNDSGGCNLKPSASRKIIHFLIAVLENVSKCFYSLILSNYLCYIEF